MKDKLKTNAEIRSLGLEALREKLGVDGMVRFIGLYGSGEGDYTEERRAFVDLETVAKIAKRIRKRRAPSKA